MLARSCNVLATVSLGFLGSGCDFAWQVSLDHGRTRAPQPRRRSRAQLSERRSAISPRRVSRKTAALRRQSCGTEGTRVLDLGPRSHCRAGLRCAADARACTELGSRPKPGLGLRRSPQSAVSHRRRTKCRFAIALRPRGASAHPFTCARERLQPGAAAGLPFALRGG